MSINMEQLSSLTGLKVMLRYADENNQEVEVTGVFRAGSKTGTWCIENTHGQKGIDIPKADFLEMKLLSSLLTVQRNANMDSASNMGLASTGGVTSRSPSPAAPNAANLATASTPESPGWRKLQEYLQKEGTSFAAVASADLAHRHAVIVELGLPPLQAAQVSARWVQLQHDLAPPARAYSAPSDALTTHFAEEKLAREQPWRSTWALVAAAGERMGEGRSLAALQQQFADRARKHRIGVQDALLLHVLLFFGATERLQLAAILLGYPDPMQRIQLFNWMVASRPLPPGPESGCLLPTTEWIAEHGHRVVASHLPLWPRDPRFADVMDDLMVALSGTSGGGGDGRAREDTFAPPQRPPAPGDAGFAEALSGGGSGAGRRSVSGVGTSVAGSASAALAASQKEVLKLQQQVAGMERKLQRGLSSSAPALTPTPAPAPVSGRGGRGAAWRGRGMTGGGEGVGETE